MRLRACACLRQRRESRQYLIYQRKLIAEEINITRYSLYVWIVETSALLSLFPPPLSLSLSFLLLFEKIIKRGLYTRIQSQVSSFLRKTSAIPVVVFYFRIKQR